MYYFPWFMLLECLVTVFLHSFYIYHFNFINKSDFAKNFKKHSGLDFCASPEPTLPIAETMLKRRLIIAVYKYHHNVQVTHNNRKICQHQEKGLI